MSNPFMEGCFRINDPSSNSQISQFCCCFGSPCTVPQSAKRQPKMGPKTPPRPRHGWSVSWQQCTRRLRSADLTRELTLGVRHDPAQLQSSRPEIGTNSESSHFGNSVGTVPAAHPRHHDDHRNTSLTYNKTLRLKTMTFRSNLGTSLSPNREPVRVFLALLSSPPSAPRCRGVPR